MVIVNDNMRNGKSYKNFRGILSYGSIRGKRNGAVELVRLLQLSAAGAAFSGQPF